MCLKGNTYFRRQSMQQPYLIYIYIYICVCVCVCITYLMASLYLLVLKQYVLFG